MTTSNGISALQDEAKRLWSDPNDPRGPEAARALVRLAPDRHQGYLLLGWACLMRGLYVDAHLAFSALAGAVDQGAYSQYRRLAQLLMQGTTVVCFDFEGHRYEFALSLFSGQALETCAYHAVGLLSEADELKYLKSFVGPCTTVVEVGVLVGNHTVFFAKNFTPRTIHLFDPNARALEAAHGNLQRNPVDPPASIVFHHAFAASASRGPAAPGDAPRIALDDVVRDVDFVKIDVDGAEMDVLRGAERTITGNRPRIMIEVEGSTEQDVKDWFAERRYVLVHEVSHEHYKNLFLAPTGSTTPSVR